MLLLLEPNHIETSSDVALTLQAAAASGTTADAAVGKVKYSQMGGVRAHPIKKIIYSSVSLCRVYAEQCNCGSRNTIVLRQSTSYSSQPLLIRSNKLFVTDSALRPACRGLPTAGKCPLIRTHIVATHTIVKRHTWISDVPLQIVLQ